MNEIGVFWDTFKLSISVSLLGALIGHYSKNGVVQLPMFVIPYERSDTLKGFPVWIRWLLTAIDFLRFIVGFRSNVEQANKRTYFELGFFGDILIGIGTGVLAKTAVQLSETQNVYAEISAAFIAGFAGLSYIRERQRKDLGLDGDSGSNSILDPSEVAQPASAEKFASTGCNDSQKEDK
ncbi:hypothetical protein [Paenibacillus alkalitolerans]|uniref:hypothetical protein n=1 Tax=Paenibacillus alkalitolerans TaxID=2799335 RepID=UPI0018F77E59|nr:hypothetical protein [Paenibacillus alkalitolerans]